MTIGYINAGFAPSGGGGGGGGGGTGPSSINWNSPVTNATLDSVLFPILGQAGDPLGLASLFPSISPVGPGHAPQTVINRVDAVTHMTGAQRQRLGQILAAALGQKPKNSYSIQAVQTMLTTAFRQAGESGSANLSDYLSSQLSTAQQSGGTTAQAAAGSKVIPPEKISQTVYTAADIQDTVDATAQKLIGRKATAAEVQGILATMNAATGARAAAQGQLDLSQQAQQAAASGATVVTGGSAAVNSAIAQAAAATGVPLNLAMAIAQQESGFNPNTVGDNGTSFGLYQLHRGGELGNMTPQQAMDPYTNALTALRVVAQVMSQHPDWSPGQIAAAAQRPANPAGYAASVNAIMGSGSANASSAGGAGGNGVSSPVGVGLKQGRVDQGVDWSGKGPLYAVGSGTIISTSNAGWPGGAFIALKLDNPVDPSHSVVYYAEDINPGVKVGDHVGAGQQIGMANGGKSGIEIGWADPNHIGQALAVATGTAGSKDSAGGTPEGQHFLSYINGTTAASGGTATDVLSQPTIGQVPADPTANEAAANFFETQRSPEYQANNLLNVFGMIQSKLASPDPALNPHVLNTPVTMK